jgi:hypothetical protein
VQDHYGRELRTGWVLLNPFKLSLDIHDVELLDRAGQRFLGFSEAQANLSATGLWQSGWILDRLYLRDLTLELVRLQPDEYNFSDLHASDSSTENGPPWAQGLLGRSLFRMQRKHRETFQTRQLELSLVL